MQGKNYYCPVPYATVQDYLKIPCGIYEKSCRYTGDEEIVTPTCRTAHPDP
jgi:hypothetical protein